MMSAKLLRKSMRVLGGAALLLLSFGLVGAFAQGTHDDPIQAGFVIVSSSDPTGLAVFETFGERRGNDTPQAGVLPSNLSDHFLLFVSMHGRLSRNLGVAVANPDTQNLAKLDLTLKDSDGNPTATTSFDVPAENQVAWMVTELFRDQAPAPEGFVGTLDIKSSAPVAVIGLRFRGMNFSTLPATQIGPTALWPLVPVAGGPGSVILPHFVTGGGWATEIVLVNTGTTELTVRVYLFKQDGTPLEAQLNGETKSTFDTIPPIPPGGVYVLSQRDKNGDSEP